MHTLMAGSAANLQLSVRPHFLTWRARGRLHQLRSANRPARERIHHLRYGATRGSAAQARSHLPEWVSFTELLVSRHALAMLHSGRYLRRCAAAAGTSTAMLSKQAAPARVPLLRNTLPLPTCLSRTEDHAAANCKSNASHWREANGETEVLRDFCVHAVAC
jgi:hypothetical protein